MLGNLFSAPEVEVSHVPEIQPSCAYLPVDVAPDPHLQVWQYLETPSLFSVQNDLDTTQPIILSPRFANYKRRSPRAPRPVVSEANATTKTEAKATETTNDDERDAVPSANVDNELHIEVGDELGRGGFGSVFLVKYHNMCYALKKVAKHTQEFIDQKTREGFVVFDPIIERDCLHAVGQNCHFITNLFGYRETPKFHFFFLEFCEWGDVSACIDVQRFDEAEARFAVACVALGLQHIHKHNIAHRDIKPDNLLIDSRGYVKITDFGCAKELGPNEKTFTVVGTPQYMAYEILYGAQDKEEVDGYGKEIDWWSLGILAFELVAQRTPFDDEDVRIVEGNILSGEIFFDPSVEEFTPIFRDLICKLVCQDVSERLSFEGVKSHPYFDGFNWRALSAGELDSAIEFEDKMEEAERSARDFMGKQVDFI